MPTEQPLGLMRACAVAASLLLGAGCLTACGPSRPPLVAPDADGVTSAEPHGPHVLGAPHGPWGAVVFREVHLTSARFVLARANLCRRIPRTDRDRDVLLTHNVEQARCRVRPYHGEVALWFTDVQGRRHRGPTLTSDRSGELRIDYAELDHAMARARMPSLDAMVALEVGRDGWAGRYDLRRLRGVLADYYFGWVEQGRGSPGLFALRHPDHPNADDASAYAVESDLARQESDFARVERGELPADAFLERHVWSPLRHSAALLLPERRTQRPEAQGDGSVGGRTKSGASGGGGP